MGMTSRGARRSVAPRGGGGGGGAGRKSSGPSTPGARGWPRAVCSPGRVASGPRCHRCPVHVGAGDPARPAGARERLQTSCGPSQRGPRGPALVSGLHQLHAPFPETLAPELPLYRSWAPGPRVCGVTCFAGPSVTPPFFSANPRPRVSGLGGESPLRLLAHLGCIAQPFG